MTHSAKTPIIAGLMTLAVLVFGFGGWGAFASIMGAVIATGRVEVQDQRRIVQHPDGGVVDRVLVREGDAVTAGQVMLVLDGDRLRAELAMAEAQYYEILARSGRLEAERDGSAITFRPELTERAARDAPVAALMRGQEGLFTARAATLAGQRAQLGERITQVESQITGLDAQIAALERQSALIAQEVSDKRRLLDLGLVPSATVMALDREAARLDGERGSLIAAQAEAHGRIVETRLEILALDSRRREDATKELRDLGLQELQLTEQRTVLREQISRLEVRAPVAGLVHGLQVAGPRAVLRAADTVAYVVPQDRPLIVAARVSPGDVDNVHPGQAATLRFTAFSSRTTPELTGRVTLVSADSFEDAETRQSYFRAEVTIDPEEMRKLGAAQVLPGMPVEVMLTTGARPAMTYLLKPVTDYFARAFRET
ncbi:HlyD family type I secretion periplasmic adaptor subunit [Paenirhodobacter populi]|uniref:HlyD family type I secretion periplasmic adaptor subunit n=1 Tax=Paenirhodobacter populi TaxID=2306993 RepID=UPI000FE33851|nr:HlyD family type I secretion periplasmic adaptor subunit [Sinirhodobacter populi]RWR04519.1 HlyD family type I secretion periplasmic adaptor subunit [Sinirhodobacter populi]